MKRLIFTVLALCTTACATVLYKPGMSQESFSRDMLTCRQAGMQEAMLGGLQGNPFVELKVQLAQKRCMHSLGYMEEKK